MIGKRKVPIRREQGATAKVRQSGEPSVEEILASIKKVIARDNRADAARDSALRGRFGEVLDLGEVASQVLPDEPPAPRIARARQEPAPEPEAIEEDDGEPLLGAESAQSMRESLAALAMLAEPRAQPQIVRQGETSLEGLVREMLRPMLADWLDANLPAMVERMVAAEIARIVHKQG